MSHKKMIHDYLIQLLERVYTKLERESMASQQKVDYQKNEDLVKEKISATNEQKQESVYDSDFDELADTKEIQKDKEDFVGRNHGQ